MRATTFPAAAHIVNPTEVPTQKEGPMNKSVLPLLAATLAACPPPINADPVETEPVESEPIETEPVESEPTGLPDDAMPLVGEWVDHWEGHHAISNEGWSMGESQFHLTAVDATEGWAVAQNDTDNVWNPDLWSRFDWTEADHNGWWFCQTAFDADTEDEALATAAADPSDPSSAGCGGFAWTRLYVPLPLRGSWVDGWGGSHDIREWAWAMGDSTYHIVDYDIEERWIVAQNDEDNTWNPGLWSRFDWTEVEDSLWFCQTAFDADTEQAARDAGPADDSAPDSSGCGGFAWSALTAED